MNDGVFVTRKTFGSVEDTLSAFYQLWMLPDMQDRANFVGYTEFDIEFEDHVSAYVRNGISEQAFCAFFHHEPVGTIEFEQKYKGSDDFFLFRAIPFQKLIKICVCGAGNEPLLLDLKKQMSLAHPAPEYPKNCFVTQKFSMEWRRNMSPDQTLKKLVSLLKKTPGLSDKIMVAGISTNPYRLWTPADENDESIKYLYAYDEDKGTTVLYDSFFDVFAATSDFQYQNK